MKSIMGWAGVFYDIASVSGTTRYAGVEHQAFPVNQANTNGEFALTSS
ncbi:hypothetical protein [Mycobacterium mantenii]|nr:hypothetical protein [Mycobacterium mantenii]